MKLLFQFSFARYAHAQQQYQYAAYEYGLLRPSPSSLPCASPPGQLRTSRVQALSLADMSPQSFSYSLRQPRHPPRFPPNLPSCRSQTLDVRPSPTTGPGRQALPLIRRPLLSPYSSTDTVVQKAVHFVGRDENRNRRDVASMSLFGLIRSYSSTRGMVS